MRFLIVCASFLTAAFGQEILNLRGPVEGWTHQAANWEASARSERTTAEGRVRSLPEIQESSLSYSSSGDLQVLLFSVESKDAAALRVHFQDFALPQDGKVYVYGLNKDGSVTRVAGPYFGSGPGNSGEFWSRSVPGSRAIIEIQLKDQLPQLPFSLRELAHLDAIEERVDELDNSPNVTRRTSIYRGMVVNHEVVDGMAVWQGDILLGRVEELEEYSGKNKNSERDAGAINGANYRWPNGVVPYVIDPALPNQQRILDAVAHWNTNLAGFIKMVPRTSEQLFVKFTPPASDSTCSSFVGKLGISNQPVSIGAQCSTGNVIHEIGHVFGLYHEQSRSDRDSYVQILTANIDPSQLSNFDVIANSVNNTAYDYNSIMHYGSTAFSNNGQATILTIPPGIPIGQRNGLAANDLASIKLLYPSTTGGTPPPPPPVTAGVTITTNPTGGSITVDGANYTAPASFTWTAGTSHTITANNTNSGNTRLAFVSWNDGGAQSHTITAPSSATSYTATYKKSHKVSLSSSSATLGAASASPASSDGFYDEGTVLTLSAMANAGSCFAGWGGIVSVYTASTSLTVNQPYAVTANFQNGIVNFPPLMIVQALTTALNAFVAGTVGCTWSAGSAVSWITPITKGGSGSGVVQFAIQPNATGIIRTGFVNVGSRAVMIVQNK